LLFVGITGSVRAQLFETRAAQAYMIDADTGTVLFSKNETDLVPPASLAKLMTMEVVFNAIRSGRLTLGGHVSGFRKRLAYRRGDLPHLDHVRRAQFLDPA
jgi:D-alanyl-D-alanine carboxypeptidase